MKNSFGHSVCLTLFGESHGEAVGCVIDGLAPGIRVDEKRIEQMLSRRRPASALDTPRRERDGFRILSGVFGGKTTGTPLCIVIPNENVRSGDYSYGAARPSHADYAAFRKYRGCEDYRGGGHFSGRITAALVAAGGILIPALGDIGIHTATHIARCGGVSDRGFETPAEDAALIAQRSFPVLDEAAGEKMQESIRAAAAAGDSLGGVTQTVIAGVPAGVGEPWFDSVEGVIARAVFGVGGVKGIQFGAGFSAADRRGSEYNDAFRMENGAVVTKTNNNGGINGGITNGMPILFDCAVKPTPSISKTQETVDFLRGENTEISIRGRHDPAIIRRICPVLDSVAALCVCDMLALRFGTDVLTKGVEKT